MRMQKAHPLRNPGKQRKLLNNAPAHLRHKLMAAPLSPELITSKGVKTLPVRKGDTIRVMRGDHKGFEGKISQVNLKKYRIYVEGLTREKVDGSTIFLPIHPSKVLIKNLNLDDKWRKGIFERKAPIIKKAETPAKKPEKKPVEKPVAVEKAAKITERKPAEAKRKKPAKVKEEKPAEPKTEKQPIAPKQEKPAKKAVVVEEKLPEAKLKPKTAQRRTPKKAAAKMKEEKKPAEEVKPTEETKSAKTKEKPRAARKTSTKASTKTSAKASAKTPTKRKTPPKTEGGT
jgi:large subunit ribosomal protein L24